MWNISYLYKDDDDNNNNNNNYSHILLHIILRQSFISY